MSRSRPRSARACSSATASSTRHDVARGRASAAIGFPTAETNWERMGALATFTVLADAVGSVQKFVFAFASVYTLLIFAYVITSWIRLPYSVWLNRIQRFLYDVCDPYLRVFRRFVPPIGPLDLSPMVAVLVLVVLQQVLHTILSQLH